MPPTHARSRSKHSDAGDSECSVGGARRGFGRSPSPFACATECAAGSEGWCLRQRAARRRGYSELLSNCMHGGGRRCGGRPRPRAARSYGGTPCEAPCTALGGPSSRPPPRRARAVPPPPPGIVGGAHGFCEFSSTRPPWRRLRMQPCTPSVSAPSPPLCSAIHTNALKPCAVGVCLPWATARWLPGRRSRADARGAS